MHAKDEIPQKARQAGDVRRAAASVAQYTIIEPAVRALRRSAAFEPAQRRR
ncbi:MAG TPA: hypothetical protein VGK20_02135 [Candidatus Binatia bacterium]|jgi:hypothetical protein